MTEVGSADLSRLLQTKRNECSSIVASRKRKLRELFAVATQVDSLPHDALANPDAPTTTPAEWQFLQANDIYQGKTLNEFNIPSRPTFSLETIKRSLAKSTSVTPEITPSAPSKRRRENASPVQNGGQPEGTPPESQPDAAVATPLNAAPLDITPKESSPTKQFVPPTTPVPKLSPEPEQPAQQPAQQPVNGIEKPTTPESPVPVAPDTGLERIPNGEATREVETEEAVQRRPTQVTFPPGTKGSPSEELKVDAEAEREQKADTTAPQKGDEPAERGVEAGSLSIKPPNETTRAPDALSSPGSTAQSATTPAVHDASTDTSPDQEGPQFVVPVNREEKQEAERTDERYSTEKGATTEGPRLEDAREQALNAPPDSAEAQLLRESINSNDTAVSAPEPAEPTQPPEPDPAAPTTDKVASTKPSAEPSTTAEVEPLDEPPSAREEAIPPTEEAQSAPMVEEDQEMASAEDAPDSQDHVTEKMDVDIPESKDDDQGQSAVSAPEEKPLAPGAQDAPSTPAAIKETPKESPQVPERAVTRVSSGAMRLKSVSEIVGDTHSPRATPTSDRHATHKSIDNQLTPLTSTPQSPFPKHKNILSHRRERSRSQASAVLFGKQPKRVEEKAIVPGQREPIQPTDDYYTPLFVQGFTGGSTWMQPIEKILFTANKTVATPDASLAIQDHQACKVLRRVYHLQQHDKWSLRQPKRCPEPTRPPSQWDVMLQEMKWMRTDFREERKWKMAIAKNLAYACAEWHGATPEERRLLQVPAVIPPRKEPADKLMTDAVDDGVENQPTPDLVPSGDVDTPENVDELAEDFAETVAPSAIFALQEDDVVFGLKRTSAADRLLDELPMYGAPLKVPKFDLTGPEYDPDAHWRRPALPLSKYVEGQMKLVSEGPPRKKSRFHCLNEESDDEDDGIFVGNSQIPQTTHLPPETNEVALFNPEMKPIRDRLHSGHHFRPPSEHPMPSQNFFECRNPSQWTVAEDDELRSLVREYSYNWSLISGLLSTRSLFSSGAERRTPWECFERWINLEGLPNDMSKTQYFKAYNNRIEAAQRTILQQNQLAMQQASAAGGAVAPIRRRPSTPIRVERRRNQKHLTLFDAMRKLAKKRETALQKQQHSASQNAAKKTNEPVIQRPIKTPRDYSIMRWERDQALAEKMAQYAQRQDAQRRAALQARVQGQAAQLAGAAGAQVGQTGAHVPGANGINGINGIAGRTSMPSQLAVAAAAAAVAAGQTRPRMPMQSPANAMSNHMAGGLVPPAPMNGVPQAQMQAMQGQQHRLPMPNPQPDVNLMMQARRISEQQRVAVQMQTQGGPGTPGAATGSQQSPPPNMRNGVNGMVNNAQALMASFNASQNGHSTPPASGLHMPSGAAASPGPRPATQLPPSIANQLNQLEAQYRAKNPNLTQEQSRQLATEHMTRVMISQRQTTTNGQPVLANSIAATTSPHQYAALLRQQQQQQANQAAGSPAPQSHPVQRQGSQAASSPAQQQQHQHPLQRQPSNQTLGSPAQQHQSHPGQRPQQQLQKPQQQQPQQQQQQQQQTPQPQSHQHQNQQQQPQQQHQHQQPPSQTPRQQTPQQAAQQTQQAQQQRQASGSVTPSAGK